MPSGVGGEGIVDLTRRLLERLDALEHFVEGSVKVGVLGDAPPKNRFQIGQVVDVDDLIDAVHERAHRVVGGETLTEQDNEMLTPLRVRASRQFRQNWIRLQSGALEIFVNDDHVVIVSLQFEQDVFFKQTEMDLVGHVDELRHNDLLILLMIDADQGSIVAQIEKCCIVFLFAKHKLMKCVFGKVETQPRIDIGIDSARFLNQIDAASNFALS